MGTQNGTKLTPLLRAAFQVGASDLHLKPGALPMYRVNGDLCPVESPPIELGDLEALILYISGYSAEVMRDSQQFEFSYDWSGVGRFRGNFYRHQGQPALALRAIPPTVGNLRELRLPPASKRICQLTQGLVLVTGATGMGKSTTLACLLSTIAQTSCRHIVTIEDPVEFMIPDGQSCVTQREVGRDVENFEAGLHAALRQDPDVLMIGEARDHETMEVVLHAAQSGHLVFSTAHFNDVTATITGIISMAPRSDQLNWRSRLAETLQAIISQRLLPRSDGSGRLLATELMLSDPAVRACILDETKAKAIRPCLERGRADQAGHTMDQSLLELVEAKLITIETARSAAASPGDLMREINLRRIA
jgi:twitching motility protein PilT